ncbi:MAG: DNA polymerase III subunit delta' [Myxococcota bacterium]
MLSFADIKGHDDVKQVLRRAIEHDRLHHALLFSGASGIGKRKMALALARVLNCQVRPPGVFQPACGTCPACRKINQGIHPDVVLVEPQGNKLKRIKIDQIRALQKMMMVSPYEGGERVVLFDDAHTMGVEAANALLKTLEEPGQDTRMIVLTDQPHALLDTIVSRCQRVRFAPLRRSVVRELVSPAVHDMDIDQALVDVAAGYGQGSPGRAMEVLHSGVLERRKELVAQLLQLERGRPRALLEFAEGLSKERDVLSQCLDALHVFLRDVLMCQTGCAQGRTINTDMTRLIQRWAARTTPERTLEMLDAVRRAQYLITRNVNVQLIIEEVARDLRTPRDAARAHTG